MLEGSSRPMVHQVLPLVEQLFEHLEKFASDMALPLVIRAAATNGWDVLKCYYGLTDNCVILSAAVSKCSLPHSCGFG